MKFRNSLLVVLFLAFYACSFQHSNEYNRKVELEGEHNFRDLGAYRTTDNQAIKKGLLYRSGTLHKLTDNDIEILEERGIKTVINFLTKSERENQGADRLPQNVKSINLPIEGFGSEVDDLIVARKTGDFSKIPADLNYSIHQVLPNTGKQSYAELFSVLADESNYPIVFHCSHGVHRTGTAAALILSILGVPWQTISDDYMLSNEYRLAESTRRVDQLSAIAEDNPSITDKAINRKNIEAFYFLQPEYIDGTKSYILENYGSFESYLQSADISQEQLEQIRNILLEE
ncbi:tyrosine-protein phosphatase [Cryomorphaceae bacterium]|nr:tyrosine-protein phosphatase [Cryomorphaceae bacterium]